MYCEWEVHGFLFVCIRCGATRTQKLTKRCGVNVCLHLLAEFPETFPPPQGGGDLLSSGLKLLGITPENYTSAKASIGLSETDEHCGCSARQKWLNKLTEKLGLGEGQGAELQSLIAMENLRNIQVNECKIHGKCLPDLRVAENQLDIIRESGYWPCQGCEERTISPISNTGCGGMVSVWP